RSTPPKFYNGRLPSDGIGRARELLNGGDSSCELPVKIQIIRIDGIADPNLCRAGFCSLIYTSRNPNVRVFIDNSGSDMLPAQVDLNNIFVMLWQQFGNVQVFADGHNFAVVHKDLTALNDSDV